MRTLAYNRDVRAMHLLTELQQAGVVVLAVRPLSSSRVAIDVDDQTIMAAVDTVVAAHDPAAIDAARAAQAQQDATDHTTVQQALATLLADATTLADPTTTLTTAQLRAMLARTDRALIAALRQVLRTGTM